MTPDTILALTDMADPVDLLMAADACEEQGAWELACWLRLTAGGGNPWRDNGSPLVVNHWRHRRCIDVYPMPRNDGAWEWSWNEFGGWDHGGGRPPGPRWVCAQQPPPEVRRVVEAAAQEAVRQLMRRNPV